MARHKSVKKKGGAVTRTKQSQQAQQEDEYAKTPHSFVIHRGEVGKSARQLVHDMRNIMSPFTAMSLKTRRKNVLKDYIAIAGPLNVTHLISFSRSELSLNLRVMRLPKGPTLTFNILEYSLCRDVLSSLKRHNMDPKQFLHHPLLVMNGIAGEGRQYPLMATMFQNMFLPINVSQVKLASIRRCVLMNYDKEEDTIEFRHFNIRTVPVGMSRGVKKLLKANVPNMANYEDISEFVIRGGNLSESEGELDGPHNEVTLPQELPGRGNMKNAQSAIRLTEVGPRMKLRLVKIETGICTGEVLYHKFIERTKEELSLVNKKRMEKKKMKEARKQQQEQNVERKATQKEEMKKKSLSGMKKKEADEPKIEVEEDDDVAYYQSAVGVEPAPELFLRRGKKRSSDQGYTERPFKKFREDNGSSRGGQICGRGAHSGPGSFRGSSRGARSGSYSARGRSSRGDSYSARGRGSRGDSFSARGRGRGSRGDSYSTRGRGSRGDSYSARGRGSRGDSYSVRGRGSRGDSYSARGRGSRGDSYSARGRGSRGARNGPHSTRGRSSRGIRGSSRGNFSSRLSFDRSDRGGKYDRKIRKRR